MDRYPLRPLRDVMRLDIDEVRVEPDGRYDIAGIYSFGKGLFKRATIQGSDTKYSSLHRLRADQFIFSRLGAWEGAVAIVPADFDNFFASQEYPTFTIDKREVEPTYLDCVCHWPPFWDRLVTRGSMKRRKRSHPERVLDVAIPIPPLEVQRNVAAVQAKIGELRDAARRAGDVADALSLAMLRRVLDEDLGAESSSAVS